MYTPEDQARFYWCRVLAVVVGLVLVCALPATGERLSGIVVPKHSNIISGLNQQFKHRNPTKAPLLVNSSSSSSSDGSEAVATRSPGGQLLSKVWLVGRKPAASSSSANANSNTNQQQYQSLYLDRNQQQLLAANPTLVEQVGGNLSLALHLSAAAAAAAAAAQEQANAAAAGTTGSWNQSSPSSGSGLVLQSQAQPAVAGGCYSFEQAASSQLLERQQLYRGFSLIELEVRSEQDRRYVSSLYGNLSAAINEQAAMGSTQTTVSPYVDVDFWSTGLGSAGERMDIMVSPKSRVFLLSQLARAKIRHRIKIDDIQARLDQLLANPAASVTAQPDQQQQQQQHIPTGSLAKSAPVDSPLSGRLSGSAGTPVDSSSAAVAANGREDPASVGGSSSLSTVGRPLNSSQFFENYQRLADINQFLETMVERAPEVARVQVIGKSSQGRYLRVLKLGYEPTEISPNVAPTTDNQPRLLNNASVILESFFRRQASAGKLGAIWIDGGTHAREWISPATALYMASRFVDNNAKCSKFYASLRALVSEHEMKRQHQDTVSYESLTAPTFEPELLTGINEINSLLLGKPVTPGRPRTNFEKTMELVAKNPEQVASESGCSLEMEQLLRRYTFYIEPVLNPDGYEYTHTHNRLWRKTRSVSSHPIYRHFCLGADPNRNYDARHGATGSSQHPCSQTFAGSVPFTEPETKHQSNFVYANRLNMKMYITLHSYSQLILLPFSHSRHITADHKDLESVGLAAAKAIEKTHGTQYKVGSSASILYTASGTASDWAYEKAGIKYSYTIELRDTGNHGFLLPRQQIIPTGEETFNGLLAMIEQMEKNENLLSSKSGLSLSQFQMADNRTLQALPNYNRAPLSDNLKSEADQRPRAPLENILDGSNTWAAPELPPSSVRDRRPMNERKKQDDLTAADVEEEHGGDSDYAFESDKGPAPEDLLSQESLRDARRRIEMRAFGRREHSRRITQVAAINSSGRSVINSPSLSGNRSSNKIRRRESSDGIVESI